MLFKEAFELMKQGAKVKLPNWGGYWVYDSKKDRIYMHTKDGKVPEIRDSKCLSYTLSNILSDEWIVADEGNTPILGGTATFSFGDAIKFLKRGLKVARKGWNGKGMYLWLKPESVIKKEWCRDPMLIECIEKNGGDILALGTISMYTHDSTGRNAILTGWLASQSDMLCEDWILVD